MTTGDTGRSSSEPIHHARTFGYAAREIPTTCGRTEQPKPATSDWTFVDCPSCLAVATPAERARREEQVRKYGGGASSA